MTASTVNIGKKTRSLSGAAGHLSFGLSAKNSRTTVSLSMNSPRSGFASRILWDSYLPRTYLCAPGYMGTLGWGFPTALGAKVAKAGCTCYFSGRRRRVYVRHARIGNSRTAQHRCDVVLLFNNNLFGNVRSMQEELYDNRVIATDLHNPDFVKDGPFLWCQCNPGHELRRTCGRPSARCPGGVNCQRLIEIPIGNDMPSTNRFKSLPKIR